MHWCIQAFVIIIGNLCKDEADDSANVFWKYNLSFLQLFLNYSKLLCLQMYSKYPGIELVSAVWRSHENI